MIARGTVLDVSAEEAQRVLHVDLACVLALSRAAGRVFVPQGSGAIVNVASLLSFQGGVLVSSYAIAKHGVLGPDAGARQRVGAARRARERASRRATS